MNNYSYKYLALIILIVINIFSSSFSFDQRPNVRVGVNVFGYDFGGQISIGSEPNPLVVGGGTNAFWSNRNSYVFVKYGIYSIYSIYKNTNISLVYEQGKTELWTMPSWNDSQYSALGLSLEVELKEYIVEVNYLPLIMESTSSIDSFYAKNTGLFICHKESGYYGSISGPKSIFVGFRIEL
jgi:hypothetical protein